jgi:hypothetical protein
MAVAKTKGANPMLTRNGKTRLGPLNLKQLQEMLEKSSKPKEKAKINSRIQELKSRPGYVEPVVEVAVEEVTE